MIPLSGEPLSRSARCCQRSVIGDIVEIAADNFGRARNKFEAITTGKDFIDYPIGRIKGNAVDIFRAWSYSLEYFEV